MITANDLRPNSVFEFEGNLYKTLTKTSSHVGRGGATVRVKIRNLRSGSTVERTFGPDVRLEDVRLETRAVEYIYNEDNLYYFMDLETYEQPAISAETLGDRIKYLKEGLELGIAFYENDEVKEPIEIVLPAHVELEVTYTEPGIQGDTAQGATKPAETESGLTIQVPLFVDIGTVIRISTETGKYITRV